jgi:hypothetical protein
VMYQIVVKDKDVKNYVIKAIYSNIISVLYILPFQFGI